MPRGERRRRRKGGRDESEGVVEVEEALAELVGLGSGWRCLWAAVVCLGSTGHSTNSGCLGDGVATGPVGLFEFLVVVTVVNVPHLSRATIGPPTLRLMPCARALSRLQPLPPLTLRPSRLVVARCSVFPGEAEEENHIGRQKGREIGREMGRLQDQAAPTPGTSRQIREDPRPLAGPMRVGPTLLSIPPPGHPNNLESALEPACNMP